MGWGSRRTVVNPAPTRTLRISEVSKAQLVAALNEQTTRVQEYRRLLEEATRTLVAITLEPDAFQYVDGRCLVAAAALAKVKNGMLLRMTPGAAGLTLTVDGETAPPIDVPRILIPAGVR